MPATFHVVAAAPLDADRMRAEIAAGERPGSFLMSLADALGAKLYEPDDGAARAPGFLEKHLLRPPARFLAVADRVHDACRDDDVVFCITEGVGLALAANLLRSGKKTRLAVFGHNIVRPRMRAAMALTPWFARIDRLYLLSPLMAATTRRRLPAMARRIVTPFEQTDDAFFTPGPARAKPRPLIIGVGLEQRDYRTLARAVAGLDVDVRISAFSKDARRQRESMPDAMPDNMSAAYYSWRDLAQLYRDADIVVAPLLPNAYAAGITSLLEAAASGRPVIATRTAGLDGAFCDPSAIVWTPPRDAPSLRAAIDALLADPALRDAQGAKARAAFLARHRKDDCVRRMADDLKALVEGGSADVRG